MVVPEIVLERASTAETERNKTNVELRQCQFSLERQYREFQAKKIHLEQSLQDAVGESTWLSRQVQSMQEEMKRATKECGATKRKMECERQIFQQASHPLKRWLKKVDI